MRASFGFGILAAASLLSGTTSQVLAADTENVDGAGSKPAAVVGATAAVPLNGFFAVVDINGALVRGRGVVRSAKVGATLGSYEVILDGPVTGCAFTATIGDPDFAGLPDAGEIRVAGRSGTTNGVFVKTSNSDGTASNRPFHLMVTC